LWVFSVYGFNINVFWGFIFLQSQTFRENQDCIFKNYFFKHTGLKHGKRLPARQHVNIKRVLNHLRMHSVTTSYCPIEQAVWRSSGTLSSSGPIRASPPSASHTDRLAPSWSDSLLASSLSSDILLCKRALIFTVCILCYYLF